MDENKYNDFFKKHVQQTTSTFNDASNSSKTKNNDEYYPDTITSTVNKINELSKKVKHAENAAQQAMQKAQEASKTKTGFFRNKKAINSIQDSLKEMATAQQVATDAQKVSFEFQKQLSETTKLLFEIGVSNIAMNRTVVRELEIKLSGASKEELNDLARQELLKVIRQLKAQEDQMLKTERNSKILRDHHNDINSMKTNIDSLEDDVDDIEKNIDTLFTEINSIKVSKNKAKQRNYNKTLKVSKNTHLKSFLLLASSLFGIVNFVGLFILGKRTKSVLLKIVSILLFIILLVFTVIMESVPDSESILNTICIFGMALSILIPSVLIIINIKSYIYADTILEYLSKYGIDVDFITPVDDIQPQPIPWVTPQIKKVSKKLFSKKYYEVLFILDARMKDIAE